MACFHRLRRGPSAREAGTSRLMGQWAARASAGGFGQHHQVTVGAPVVCTRLSDHRMAGVTEAL